MKKKSEMERTLNSCVFNAMTEQEISIFGKIWGKNHVVMMV